MNLETVNQAPTTRAYWNRKGFRYGVFGILALIFIVNRNPYVGFDDGLTFLYAARFEFDPATNATSHFFYLNFQHLLVSAFSFVNPVTVLTLFSIASAMGCLGLLYRMGLMFTPHRGMALVPVVMLGLAFTFWQQSEIIEVYAFNNLIFSAYFYLALKDIVAGKRHNRLWVSLLLGIALLTHIQHILSLPFFIFYIWGRNGLKVPQKLLAMLPWMALMSILFILPLITHRNPVSAVFFEKQFQDEVLGMDPIVLGKGILMGIGFLIYNFHLGLGFMFDGAFRLWKEKRGLALWLLLLLLPYLAFAFKYSVRDNHVFFLIPYLILSLLAVFSLERLAPKIGPRMKWIFPAMIVLPIVFYASATLIGREWGPLKAYDHDKAYKGGVVHLLWPGQFWAKDPLRIAWNEAHLCQTDPADKIEEWNFKTAVRYLQKECEGNVGTDRSGWTAYPPLSAQVDSCFFNCPELRRLNQNFSE
jgi:hypothetical protein